MTYKIVCPVTKKVWNSDKAHSNQSHYVDGAALIRVNAGFYSCVAEYVGLSDKATSPKELMLALTKKLGFEIQELGFVTLKAQLETLLAPKVAKADIVPTRFAQIEATIKNYRENEMLTDYQIIEKMRTAKLPEAEIAQHFAPQYLGTKIENLF